MKKRKHFLPAMENIKTAIHTYAASAGKTCLPKGLLPLLPVLFLTMASLPVFPLFSVSAQALAQEEGMAARAQEENETSVHTQEEEAEDSAGRLWTEEYYRAVDTTGGLSEAEVESLDNTCLEFMQAWKADLSLLAVKSSDHEGASLAEVAEGYYMDCGFGYGSGRDGFQMVWDTETGEVLIKAFGQAQSLIPESYLEFVAGSVGKFEEEYGHFGPMYATARHLSNYLRGSGDSDTADPAAAAAGEAGAAAGGGDAEDPAAASAAVTGTEGSETRQTDTEAGTDRSSKDLQPGDLQTIKSADAGTGETGSSAGSGEGRMLPDGQVPDADLRVGEGADMPAWYPKDPAGFPFYHDESAPRVVDVADLFSDREEAQMEARLSEIRSELGKDIVIFTDVSTYGLSRSVYAADFYDFNGYGIGEDREGVCLMVCMDPQDRGWWCCCTGPETMGLYTETVANQIDDLLYEYMRAGEYGPGVSDWIENFRRIYVTGSPYNEAWALIEENSFERFHDADAPRIVDDAGLFTGEEIGQLRAQASSISEKYGVDVVIHTALNEGLLDRSTYADRFYITHGYGLGENYDGIQLTIFKRPNYEGGEVVSAYGSPVKKLTQVNQRRLESRCDSLLLPGQYYQAAGQWLSQTDHMLRTGRAPRSSASWEFTTILELLAGLVFGGISLGRAKVGMATPQMKVNADSYVEPGSLKIKKVRDTFLDSRVNRIYSPPPKEDHSDRGSSSGGSSSYSGSYSGSSGSTHSGSGRNF
ncbi:MAG: TPM domain-containing protein [Sarcina sp.]|nr:TPM domain-containing protein [Sarcina sp.]